jgi:anaerobic selenocysteine-containing dehydrogenase
MAKVVHTFCRICEPFCPLSAEVDDSGEVVKLRPDKEHPVSLGAACHKGLSYLEVHYDPDRPTSPLRRSNPRAEPIPVFEPISWTQAMDEIGERLRAIRNTWGANAIGTYAGQPAALNSATFFPMYSFGPRVGSTRTFNAATQDTSNKFAAIEAVYGSMQLTIPDFFHTDFLLCLGANPKVSHWTLISTARTMDGLNDIVSRGGKVRFVNPRRIESVRPGAGELIQIKPDTDVYLLAAMLHEIDREGGFDETVIAKHGKNIAGLRAFIARYPPERVAPITGIDVEAIRTLAREFAAAPSASTYMATGSNQGRQGTLTFWLLTMLSFVTGNLGRKGGDYFAKGVSPTATPAASIEAAFFDTPFGKMRHLYMALPATTLPDFIELENDPVRALIVLAGNPLLSMPGEARLRKALPMLELMISVDLYRNATAEYADYILPTPDWLERSDVNILANGVQPHPYAQYTEAVVPPRHGRMPDWWILARMEQELGIASALDETPPNPHAGAEQMLKASGLSIEALREMPHGTAVLPQPDRSDFYNSAVLSPDKKIDCCPAVFVDAIERCEQLFQGLLAEPAERLKLIGLRTNYMINSNLANMKSLKRPKHAENHLHMSPVDASSRGLKDGDIVRVSNPYGALMVAVLVDDTLLKGVVALSHGYGHQKTRGQTLAYAAPGVNYNQLAPVGPGSFEALSNMAQLTGIPVVVESLTANRCGDQATAIDQQPPSAAHVNAHLIP